MYYHHSTVYQYNACSILIYCLKRQNLSWSYKSSCFLTYISWMKRFISHYRFLWNAHFYKITPFSWTMGLNEEKKSVFFLDKTQFSCNKVSLGEYIYHTLYGVVWPAKMKYQYFVMILFVCIIIHLSENFVWMLYDPNDGVCE